MSDESPHICLASRSPRRAELLTQIGVRFVVVPADSDERVRTGESPEIYVRRIALDKARLVDVSAIGSGGLPVLAADTAVVLGDSILGKPSGEPDAMAMLRALSGREHRVLTGVALVTEGRIDYVLSTSRVRFRAIAETEMRRYWRTGEPCDKAGGYAIQGLGALFVAGLEGSYSGVMGLPLFETGQLLEGAGIRLITPEGAGGA